MTIIDILSGSDNKLDHMSHHPIPVEGGGGGVLPYTLYTGMR